MRNNKELNEIEKLSRDRIKSIKETKNYGKKVADYLIKIDLNKEIEEAKQAKIIKPKLTTRILTWLFNLI